MGPLIHNEHVVRMLEERGARCIDSLNEAGEGETVVIRSHGAPPQVYQQMAARGISFIDATCPFVKRIHERVLDAKKKEFPLSSSARPDIRRLTAYSAGQVMAQKWFIPMRRSAQCRRLIKRSLWRKPRLRNKSGKTCCVFCRRKSTGLYRLKVYVQQQESVSRKRGKSRCVWILSSSLAAKAAQIHVNYTNYAEDTVEMSYILNNIKNYYLKKCC